MDPWIGRDGTIYAGTQVAVSESQRIGAFARVSSDGSDCALFRLDQSTQIMQLAQLVVGENGLVYIAGHQAVAIVDLG